MALYKYCIIIIQWSIEQTINVHRPYHQSRRRMVPVALITAADGVCHPTPAALIISRQRRHSIYPHRGRADCERTNENNDKRWRNRARTVGNDLSDRGLAGGIGCSKQSVITFIILLLSLLILNLIELALASKHWVFSCMWLKEWDSNATSSAHPLRLGHGQPWKCAIPIITALVARGQQHGQTLVPECDVPACEWFSYW